MRSAATGIAAFRGSIVLVGAAAFAGSAPFAQLRFEQNLGQAAPEVQFAGRADRHRIYFKSEGLEFRFPTAAFHLSFEGASQPARFEPRGSQITTYSYYLGANPSKWIAGAAVFDSIIWREAYPGIDIVFRGQGGHLEYDLIVAAGADPSPVRLRFQEADASADADGALALTIGPHRMRHRVPAIYQQKDGMRTQVAGRFVRDGSGAFRLDLGPYDTTLPLVVDPVLESASYFGGEGDDRLIAFESGMAAGTTTSLLASYSGSGRPRQRDIFLTQIRPGGEFGETTILGGSGDDDLTSIAIKARLGFGPPTPATTTVLLSGSTDSPDLPFASNAPGGGADGFLIVGAVVGPRSFQPSASLYVGGSGDDAVVAVGVHSFSTYFGAGHTTSKDLPVVNAQQPESGGGQDAFFVQLREGPDAPVTIESLTYWGGSGDDRALDAVLSPDGGGFVAAGETESERFPMPGDPVPLRGASDAFLLRFRSTAAGLNADRGLRLGGSGRDRIAGLARSPISPFFYVPGRVYAAGTTTSPDLPATNGPFGDSDAFLAAIDADKLEVERTSYYGGSGADEALAIRGGPLDHVWIAGRTRSPDLGLRNPFQAELGGPEDAFVALLDPAGQPAFATYYGGSGSDRGTRLQGDGSFKVTLIGETDSSDLPVLAPFQPKLAGGNDAFYANFDAPVLVAPREIALGRDLVTGLLYATGSCRTSPQTHFRSLDPSKVTLRIAERTGLAEADLPLRGSATVRLEGHANEGETAVEISAPGCGTESVKINLYPAVLTANSSAVQTSLWRTVPLSAWLGVINPATDRPFPQAFDSRVDHQITWTNTNPDVAELNSNALVPKSIGSTTLTYVSSHFPAEPGKVEVSVTQPAIELPDLTLGKNTTALLSFTTDPFATRRGPTTFRSSDSSLVTLAANGSNAGATASPLPGSSGVFVHALSDSGSVTITVSSPDFQSVTGTVRLTGTRLTIGADRQKNLVSGSAIQTFASLEPAVESATPGLQPPYFPRPGALSGTARFVIADPAIVEVSPPVIDLSGLPPVVALRAKAEGSTEIRLVPDPGADWLLPSLPLRIDVKARVAFPDLPSEIFVGRNLQTALPRTILGAAKLRVEDPAAATLSTSADGPGQAEIVLSDPAATAAYIRGGAKLGSTHLWIEAPGSEPVQIPLHVWRSGFAFQRATYSAIAGNTGSAVVAPYVLDEQTGIPWIAQRLNPGIAARVAIKSSNPEIGTSGAAVFPSAGRDPTLSAVNFSGSQPGEAILTLGPQPEGFDEPSRQTTVKISITSAAFPAPGFTTAVFHAVTPFRITGPPMWTATSRDPSRLLLSSTEPPAQPSATATVTAIANRSVLDLWALDSSGKVTIDLSARGFETKEVDVYLQPLTVRFGPTNPIRPVWPLLSAGGAVELRYPDSEAALLQPGAPPLRLILRSSNPSLTVPEPSEISIEPGSSGTSFRLPIAMRGEAEITMEAPMGVEVDGPPLRVIVR